MPQFWKEVRDIACVYLAILYMALVVLLITWVRMEGSAKLYNTPSQLKLQAAAGIFGIAVFVMVFATLLLIFGSRENAKNAQSNPTEVEEEVLQK